MNGKANELTMEGKIEREKELERLRNVDRIRNREALKEARAQGDLSENAEYDAAREEQSRIEGRIKELETILQNAVIIGSDKVYTVYFLDDDEQVDYTIVGSVEADPMNNRISSESPLGAALLDHRIGDKVSIKTETGDEYEVLIKNIKG